MATSLGAGLRRSLLSPSSFYRCCQSQSPLKAGDSISKEPGFRPPESRRGAGQESGQPLGAVT